MFDATLNKLYLKLGMGSMTTLRFTIKGVEFEFIGEQDEVIAFINRFMYEDASLHGDQTKPRTSRDAIPLPPRRTLKPTPDITRHLGITNLPLVDNEAIISYITQKPSYEHTLPEIQRKFYGKVFSSRGSEQGFWHRTSRQLKIVRETIEKRFGGRFKEGSAGARNLKKYTFIHQNQVVLLEEEPRTS